jgi:mannose-6-phosphate isomerase-like protein (cupin superfamily)
MSHQTEDDDLPESEEAVEPDEDDDFDDYGEPFEPRSFGGEFVWAEAPGYTCKILRVRPGEKVLVSTRGRKDMVVMLTGGRAILEVLEGDETDRVEIMPGAPVRVHPEREHRLVAMTEVEMFVVYTVEG